MAVEIDTWAELAAISSDLTGDYILTGSLSSATTGYSIYAGPTANGNTGWIPLGNSTTNFTGTFDGDGFTISDLVISRSSSDYQGLFGRTNQATITDLGMIDVDITDNLGRCGVMVGWANSAGATIITNCYTTGTIGTTSVNGRIGGFGGFIHNFTATNCYSEVIVTSSGVNTGGFSGSLGGTITDCYATGNVTGAGTSCGGFSGQSVSATKTNCYATGTVTNTGTPVATGGFIGLLNGGTITDCYATGNVTAYNTPGGFIGEVHDGDVSNCYATGNVTGFTNCGGLIGLILSTTFVITDCYATGSVSGAGNESGGLVGILFGTLTNCYSSGAVSSVGDTGGLVSSTLSTGSSTNCFWDTETSGQATSDEGTGKTTAQMKDFDTFNDAGWDIQEITGVLIDYPRLDYQKVGITSQWYIVKATNMQMNIGDSWKGVNLMKINIGDAWKDVAAVKQNIGDVWKEVF